MDLILSFAASIIDFINALYIFFFVPLKVVPSALYTTFFSGSHPMLDRFFENVFNSWIFHLTGLADFTFAELLLGAGITIFILWRVALFFVPKFSILDL